MNMLPVSMTVDAQQSYWLNTMKWVFLYRYMFCAVMTLHSVDFMCSHWNVLLTNCHRCYSQQGQADRCNCLDVDLNNIVTDAYYNIEMCDGKLMS